jgi:putative transcriptional regulator
MKDSALAPRLLLSMPQLNDPNFALSVVLLCEYSEDGAFGLVLNRPTDMPAASVVQLDPPLGPAAQTSLRLWVGGPVEPQRGWILLDREPDEAEFRVIRDGLYLATSPALLRRLLEARTAPRARVLAGYAGWGPGQLDAEIEASAWLTADIDLDLVFDVDPDVMWETAVRRLGAEPSSLQMSPGVH